MGWSSGVDIATDMITAIQKNVESPKTRRTLYKALIKSLESADCDNLYEAAGIDEVFGRLVESGGS